MIPRGSIDMSWMDLFAGLRACLLPPSEASARAAAETASGAQRLACLSVRSGLDLTLQALALPPGSEVLVSAVTIPDMVRVLEHHQLVAIPVDLDLERLTVTPEALDQAVTPRTRAILVAHLFGSLMDLDALVNVARQYGLFLIEDCAQAYDGAYSGHPASDLALFSFGPIKTSTALGGAILRFRDPTLLAQVSAIQASYPIQARGSYLRRILMIMGIKLLAHPFTLGLMVRVWRRRGRNHDEVISTLLRGFPGTNLIDKLRQRPSAPLLALLARRLRQPARIAQRTARARSVIELLPAHYVVGATARRHTFWVLPIVSSDPEALVQALWAAGFDASRKGSSLYVVAPPPGREAATNAAAAIERLVYLPLHPALDAASVARMARVLAAF